MDTLLLDRRTQGLIEGYVPEGELLFSLTRFFSIFADGTRLRILSALAISDAGMVCTERHGKIIFYSLYNEIVNDILLKGVEFLGY